MKKGLSVFTAVTTTLWLLGAAFLLAPAALAVIPADYGLTEGDVISAWDQAGDPDVYIVNDHGYKRLFLNPAIFGFYGHLGFDKVVNISPTARDAFVTSGLFRNCEADDLKVYGVETTGEDTGELHWVNMSGSAAVAEDADFFKKVFCINNNEFNWYTSNGTSFGSDYTSLSQVPDYERGETGVVTGPVALSVAPGNPAARTITTNAAGLEVLRIRLTGTGTLQSIVLTRGGAGDTDDFSNVYLYDGIIRLTSGRSVGSAGTVTYSNLGLVVNGTRDISVLVDMGTSSNAGNVHYFEVAAAGNVSLAGGTSAGGSYPVRGSNFSVSAASSGTLTVNGVGSISNPSVGGRQAQISEFKLTTATEGANVRRMRLINAGTVNDSDITNVVVKTLVGDQVATGTMNGSGYLDLDFGDPGYWIAKGSNKTFLVYADLGGKRDETIILYTEVDADTHAVGAQFGFGMAVADTDFDSTTSGEAHSLTLQGGDLTLTFLGPSTTNVGTETQDTHLIDFTMNASRDIELKSHKILFCLDNGGNGTFNNLASESSTANFADLEDIKIVNVDTGVVLVGPVDGSALTTASASCPAGTVGGVNWSSTDAFDVLGGQTLNLAITADFKTANDATGESDDSELDNGDKVRIIYESYSDLAGANGNLTVAKYIGTNTPVKAAQIVPSGDIASNDFTISTSGLTIGLAGSPVDKTVVKGTQGVEAVAFTFKAALASSVTVKKLTLTGKSGTGTGTTATANVGSLINSIELYDGDTGAKLSGNVISNLLSSAGTIQFDNIGWVIPAGETKTLLVKTNLSTNAVPTNNVFAFDIAATTDVTALDQSNTTVTITGSDVNLVSGNTTTVDVTVSSAGTLAVAKSPDTEEPHALYWGETGNSVGTFRFTATNEAFHIEKLTFGASGSTEATDMTANVKSVTLEYRNKLGNTVTVTQSMTAGATVNFGFSGDNKPYVPKDSSTDIKVMANMKNKSEGATSTGVADALSPTFIMRYHDTYSGSETDGVRAVGEGSGTVLTGASAGIGSEVSTTKSMYVYRVFPKFEQVTLSPGEPIGLKDVFKFTISAMGLDDSKLFFDNTADASGSITFAVHASGDVATTNITPTTYSGAKTYDSSTAISAVGDDATATVSYVMNFGENTLEITGGQSKTLAIQLSFTGFNDRSDYLQMRLMNNEDALVNWVDNSTNTSADSDVSSIAGVLSNLPMNGQTFSKL